MFFVLPTNGPEAAMEESAMDIVGQLMQQDLNYENLVQRFHGLALKRRKEVRCLFFPFTIALLLESTSLFELHSLARNT